MDHTYTLQIVGLYREHLFQTGSLVTPTIPLLLLITLTEVHVCTRMYLPSASSELIITVCVCVCVCVHLSINLCTFLFIYLSINIYMNKLSVIQICKNL